MLAVVQHLIDHVAFARMVVEFVYMYVCLLAVKHSFYISRLCCFFNKISYFCEIYNVLLYVAFL